MVLIYLAQRLPEAQEDSLAKRRKQERPSSIEEVFRRVLRAIPDDVEVLAIKQMETVTSSDSKGIQNVNKAWNYFKSVYDSVGLLLSARRLSADLEFSFSSRSLSAEIALALWIRDIAPSWNREGHEYVVEELHSLKERFKDLGKLRYFFSSLRTVLPGRDLLALVKTEEKDPCIGPLLMDWIDALLDSVQKEGADLPFSDWEIFYGGASFLQKHVELHGNAKRRYEDALSVGLAHMGKIDQAKLVMGLGTREEEKRVLHELMDALQEKKLPVAALEEEQEALLGFLCHPEGESQHALKASNALIELYLAEERVDLAEAICKEIPNIPHLELDTQEAYRMYALQSFIYLSQDQVEDALSLLHDLFQDSTHFSDFLRLFFASLCQKAKEKGLSVTQWEQTQKIESAMNVKQIKKTVQESFKTYYKALFFKERGSL